MQEIDDAATRASDLTRRLLALDRGRPMVPASAGAMLSQPETILIVEDEHLVRKVARATLAGQGYEVLTADSGPAALEVFEKQSGNIELLVTDVVMPQMTGQELAEELQARSAELKVIFTSGYSEDIIGMHGVLDPGLNVLEKPFHPEALVETVRKVLDSD